MPGFNENHCEQRMSPDDYKSLLKTWENREYKIIFPISKNSHSTINFDNLTYFHISRR